MAVTTGTTWDIVLANEAPVPAQTSAVSPRAAYQAAIYARAALVDVRPASLRARQGALPAELGAAVVGRDELRLWLRESLATRVHVLDGGAPVAPGDLATGDARVSAVEGGFPGWLTAGLPTA